jgi:hypothetical protein
VVAAVSGVFLHGFQLQTPVSEKRKQSINQIQKNQKTEQRIPIALPFGGRDSFRGRGLFQTGDFRKGLKTAAAAASAMVPGTAAGTDSGLHRHPSLWFHTIIISVYT